MHPITLTASPAHPSSDDDAAARACFAHASKSHSQRNTSLPPPPVVFQRSPRAAPYLFDFEQPQLQGYHGVRGWQVDSALSAWNDLMGRALARAAVELVGVLDEENMSAPFWGGQHPGDPLQVSRDALHWWPGRRLAPDWWPGRRLAPDADRSVHWFMANVALVLLNLCVAPE